MNSINQRPINERGMNMQPKACKAKRTHLIAALLGIVVLSIFAADAAAMYHPGMGRFLSRDPGAGGAMRIGAGGAAPVGGFIPRDPTGSNPYADGMNLYQYVRSSPVRYRDPSGLNAYDDYKKLNPAERSVVFWNPIDACRSRGCPGTSFAAAKKSGLPGAHNGPQDAFRHCVWTCCMTQNSNADFSKKMSDAHETTSTSKDETAMDLHNNGVGIGIGKGGGKCAAGCKDALKKGKLRVLRQAGSGPVPPGTPLQPSR